MKFNRVLRAYGAALRDFFLPSILALNLTCFVAGLVIWWGVFTLVAPWLSQGAHDLLIRFVDIDFSGFWGGLLIALLLIPLVFLVWLALFSWLAVPWVKRVLRARGWQDRPSRGGLSLFRQITWAAAWIAFAILVWFLSWLFVWIPVVPAALTFAGFAWLQWRLLALEIWGETQDVPHFRQLLKNHRQEGWLLSAGLLWFAAVPVLGFFVPLLAALSFLHWDQELRNEKA